MQRSPSRTTRRLRVGLIALLGVSALGAGCGSDDDAKSTAPPPTSAPAATPTATSGSATSLSGSNWTLAATGVPVSVPAGASVTIAFTGDTVSGVSGCNNYTGSYTVTDQGGLQLGPLASTRKACDEPVMAVETAYLAALDQVDAYAVDGDQLVLSAGTTELLRFDRA